MCNHGFLSAVHAWNADAYCWPRCAGARAWEMAQENAPHLGLGTMLGTAASSAQGKGLCCKSGEHLSKGQRGESPGTPMTPRPRAARVSSSLSWGMPEPAPCPSSAKRPSWVMLLPPAPWECSCSPPGTGKGHFWPQTHLYFQLSALRVPFDSCWQRVPSTRGSLHLAGPHVPLPQALPTRRVPTVEGFII